MKQFYLLSKKFLFLKYLHVHLIEDTGDYSNPLYLIFIGYNHKI